MIKYLSSIEMLGRPALAVTPNGSHYVYIVVLGEPNAVLEQLDIGKVKTVTKKIISNILVDTVEKFVIDGIDNKVILCEPKYFKGNKIYTKYFLEVVDEA